MNIKEVEACTGLKRTNIRFYESKGLLRPERGRNNYRNYTEQDAERLRQIVLFRNMGMSIEYIQRIFDGTLTLQEAAKKTWDSLQQQDTQKKGALALCETICEREESLDTLSVGEYEQIICELQEDKKWFQELIEDTVYSNLCLVWFPWVWDSLRFPRQYWFIYRLIELEVIAMPVWGIAEVMAPYSKSLIKDFIMIQFSFLIIYIIWTLWLLICRLNQRSFPTERQKERRIVQAAYMVMCVFWIVWFCWNFWKWFSGGDGFWD